MVAGLGFLPENTISIKLQILINKLITIHNEVYRAMLTLMKPGVTMPWLKGM